MEDSNQAERPDELQINASEKPHFFRMSHVREDSGEIAVGDPEAKRIENPDKPADTLCQCHNDRQGKKIDQENDPS